MVDEGFDGIDNDGDGIIDPGFNGLDDDGDGIVDEHRRDLPAPDRTSYVSDSGSASPSGAVGLVADEFDGTASAAGRHVHDLRRPVPVEGAREILLPTGVVIDLTTSLGTTTCRSGLALPVDPIHRYVDVMIAPNGQVVDAGRRALDTSRSP